jgi:2-methylcitrate dehydratase PrpD
VIFTAQNNLSDAQAFYQSVKSKAAAGGLSGERFLAAYAVGVETVARLGLSIGADHYAKGWHNTATLGGIAAAVAAGFATGEQGRFSAEYVVALALLGVPLSLESFANAPILADIARFMQRVERSYDETVQPASHAVPKGRFTIVKVIAKEGRLCTARVDRPRGAAGNRLSPAELQQKLTVVWPDDPARAGRVIAANTALHSETDLQELPYCK